ncbi:MAG: hypothetical protein AABX93_00190 [Nanoarchaeota archaeon]
MAHLGDEEREEKMFAEIKPAKNNFLRNLATGITIAGLVGIFGQGIYAHYFPKAKENLLERYFCVENIKPRWEENLETYANHIVWENPDKKFTGDNVLKFLIKFNGKIDEHVRMGEDIIIPVYSVQVCRRLGLPEN